MCRGYFHFLIADPLTTLAIPPSALDALRFALNYCRELAVADRFCCFALLVLVLLVCLASARPRHQHRWTHHTSLALTLQRLLKPRTPADCPACRQLATAPADPPPAPASLRPWRALKSRPGAAKRTDTQPQG